MLPDLIRALSAAFLVGFVPGWFWPAAVIIASPVVLLAGSLVGFRAVQSLENASGPSVQLTITPEISAAGEWLREHNDGAASW